MTHTTNDDVIDRLAGVRPGDALDLLRARRPLTRFHAEQSHRALFEPVPLPEGCEPSRFDALERHALAFYVASLHAQADFAAFHAEGIGRADAKPGLFEAVAAEAAAGAAAGPYGRYPSGPLSTEDTAGPVYRVDASRRPLLGQRLAAALEHAHLLVLHPRDAKAADLQALLDAGWTSTEIVSLSQLVAFLSFQIRVVAGLRVLAAHPSTSARLHEHIDHPRRRQRSARRRNRARGASDAAASAQPPARRLHAGRTRLAALAAAAA